MKIRLGFVSNSSSASFIISFKSSLSIDEISNMIRKSDEWLDRRWEETKQERLKWESIRKGEPEYDIVDCTPEKDNFLKINNGVFEIHPSTTMFNDWMDVPAWKFIRALSENKIPNTRLNKIIQTEEEFDDINKETEFDEYCWEYESHHHDLQTGRFNSVKEAKKSEIEAEKRQKYVKYEYLSYLSNVDVPLSREESIFLAKNHLYLLD